MVAPDSMKEAALEMLASAPADLDYYEPRLDVIKFLAALIPRGHYIARYADDSEVEYSIPLLMAAVETRKKFVFSACLFGPTHYHSTPSAILSRITLFVNGSKKPSFMSCAPGTATFSWQRTLGWNSMISFSPFSNMS